MKLRELMSVVYENVNVYKEVSNNEFQDLYKGSYRDVPEGLLDRTVIAVGVRKYSEVMLEVEIR